MIASYVGSYPPSRNTSIFHRDGMSLCCSGLHNGLSSRQLIRVLGVVVGASSSGLAAEAALVLLLHNAAGACSELRRAFLVVKNVHLVAPRARILPVKTQ